MKIICIGRNYAEHAKEMKSELPTEPVFFMKPDTALLKDQDFYFPEFTKELHHEIEVVIKIAKAGKHIEEQFASRYYNEVGLGIDFTARDIQAHCKGKGLPWEKAKAFDNSAPIGQFISLDGIEKNNISFSYQAITLSGNEQVTYRYRLEGSDMADAPWSEWTSTNSVTYSALPPGNYTFRVQCMGADETSYPEETYQFEIITPLYKTRWFNLVVLFGCILVGVCIQYLYTRRKIRRQKLRTRLRAEEQAKVRMRTAEDFHDEIGNKL
ncbi:MAG: hypothetical protein EBU33_06190, partial [Sphingobacteriia bacterium]|nr:hypothetical protein [Sphingobacteriia bacterium]